MKYSNYFGLYLKEEINEEGLTRSIDHFSRFLDLAALSSGEQINFTEIGSDAQISPSTIRSFYEILNDTLIGKTLPAFLATKKRKAMTTAKFYLFDTGVCNALTGRSQIPPGTPEFGKALEHAIFNEINAYIDYNRLTYKVEYWRSTSQLEVDFVIYNNLNDLIAIEVKSKQNPSLKDYSGLLALEEEFKIKRKLIICQSPTARLTKEGIEILPIKHFLDLLWSGKIIG